MSEPKLAGIDEDARQLVWSDGGRSALPADVRGWADGSKVRLVTFTPSGRRSGAVLRAGASVEWVGRVLGYFSRGTGRENTEGKPMADGMVLVNTTNSESEGFRSNALASDPPAVTYVEAEITERVSVKCGSLEVVTKGNILARGVEVKLDGKPVTHLRKFALEAAGPGEPWVAKIEFFPTLAAKTGGSS